MDDLTKDEVAQLAGESEEAIVERAQFKEKLSALEVGLQDLRNLETHHTLAALGKHYSHHLELFFWVQPQSMYFGYWTNLPLHFV